MFIIKKLIIKEWYKFFLSASLVLFLLLTVANLISGFLRGNVTPFEVIVNHILELPSSINKIFPISCLVASLFSINKLKNRNELVAIFSSGYSRKQFIFSVVQASLFVALLQFLLAAFIQPLAKSRRHQLIQDSESKFRNLKSQGLRASTIGSGKIWYKAHDYFFAFSSFDKLNSTLENVDLYFFNKEHQLQKKIFARRVIHARDNFWTFQDGYVYENLDTETFPESKKFKEVVLPIGERPEDFRQIESDITTLNLFNLYRYIAKLKQAGINISEYQVAFLDAFSSTIICIIFTLVAATPVFNPNRRTSSIGKSLAFIFVFTIFYWLIYSYFIEMGKNSKIDPYVATFGVPAIFTIYLFYYFRKNRALK